MPDKRNPRPGTGGVATTTFSFEDNDCECELYGDCARCSDQRRERPLVVEFVLVAEAIATQHNETRVSSERQQARQLMFIWGSAA